MPQAGSQRSFSRRPAGSNASAASAAGSTNAAGIERRRANTPKDRSKTQRRGADGRARAAAVGAVEWPQQLAQGGRGDVESEHRLVEPERADGEELDQAERRSGEEKRAPEGPERDPFGSTAEIALAHGPSCPDIQAINAGQD